MKITHCKFLKKQQLKFLEYFVLEVTARSANILNIQPNTAMLFYRKIRQVINHHCAFNAHAVFDGAVELDERYFGGARKGRGAAGKVVVFGILKHCGRVFTQVVNDTHSARFATGKNHINGIAPQGDNENFWNQAKRVLRKYIVPLWDGTPKQQHIYSRSGLVFSANLLQPYIFF